jgi:hypothetical protein
MSTLDLFSPPLWPRLHYARCSATVAQPSIERSPHSEFVSAKCRSGSHPEVFLLRARVDGAADFHSAGMCCRLKLVEQWAKLAEQRA